MKPMNAIQQLKVRSRAACVMAIAERALPVLNGIVPLYTSARYAIDIAWDWIEGGDVTGEAIYHSLENDTDTGMLTYEWETSGVQESASVCISSAVAYVCWHVYLRSGNNLIPSSILEVTEDTISVIIQLATKAGVLDDNVLNGIVQRCSNSNNNGLDDDLGVQISRMDIIA